MQISRANACRALLVTAATNVGFDPNAAFAAIPAVSTAAVPTSRATVTQRVYLDVRIIKSFQVEVLEDAAIRGRLVIGLFGKDAPNSVDRFLDFVKGTIGQYQRSGGGPAYSSATFDRIRPGELLEGGKIAGLKQTEFAGNMEWEYMSRLLPLRPVPRGQ